MPKPLMVAVGGGSGSGKTTVVKLLESYLTDIGVLVVSQDHYYRDLSHLSKPDRDSQNFDHPDALDRDLLREQMEALAQGKSIQRPTYDFATHTRSAAVANLDPRPIIFFDGIFALADANLLRNFDMSIYVDVPNDLRILRRLCRDVAERGRTAAQVYDQYIKTVRPMHEQFIQPTKKIADMVLDWIERDEAKVKALAQLLRQKLADKK